MKKSIFAIAITTIITTIPTIQVNANFCVGDHSLKNPILLPLFNIYNNIVKF